MNIKPFISKIKALPKYQLGIIAGVIILLLIIIISKNSSDELSIHTVERTDVFDTIQLAGVVDVDQRVDLGFATSGRVTEVYVEEGERVRKGQTIARIDQNQLQASLIQAEANRTLTSVDTSTDLTGVQGTLETTKAQQDALVKGAYESYLSGDLQAYYNDDSSRNVVAPIISGSYLGNQEGEYLLRMYGSNTQSGYSFSLSGLENGTYSAEVYQPGPLGQKGLYILFDPNSNYRDTTWVVPVPNVRSATYVTRKSAYESALATREQVLQSTENEYNRITGSSGNISRTEALQKQANAQVNAVYAQLNDGKITAPFDGVIARNTLEVGQIVSAYDAVVTLFGSTERLLELYVPEIYINKVAEGNSVEITLDAYADELFSGVIDDVDIIDTIVDGVPVYKTTVMIESDDPRMRIGMNAKARITSDKRLDVIAIPKHYLVTEEEGTHVLLYGEREPVKQIVEVGFEGNDGLVEIISGLNEGDRIVRPSVS